MKILVATCVGVAVGLALTLGAASACAADLLEVFRRAQAQDAGYASARSAWSAAQEKVPQGRALLLPNASVSANGNYNDRKIEFRNGILALDKYNTSNVTASVTQPLYRPGSFAQYEQAKAQVAQADAQIAAALQDLIVRVAQAYFDVLFARDVLESSRAQKVAIAQQHQFAKKSYDLGMVTAADVHEAQARYDLVASQEIAAQNELESRQRVLQQILNAEPPPLTPVRETFAPVPPVPASMDAWVDEAVRNSRQVQSQVAATEVAEKEVQRQRSGHRPTLDLVASHLRSAAGSGIQGGPGLDTVATIVGVQLAVPIYQGGGVNSRVREAAANLARANDDLDNVRRTAALNARQAFLGVSYGVSQIASLRSAVASSQRQLDSTQLGRKVGVRNIVDVLNAQQQYYATQRDLAQAIYAYILNDLKLKLAVGTLSESDVERVNAWLGGSGPLAQRERGETAIGATGSGQPIEASLPSAKIVRSYFPAQPAARNGGDGWSKATSLGLQLTLSLSEPGEPRAAQKQKPKPKQTPKPK